MVRECGKVLFCKYIIYIYRGEEQVAERGPPRAIQGAAVHRHSLDSLHTINDSLKKISVSQW